MADKKSFLIYDNWANLIVNLPAGKAGELIQAICNYKLGNEIGEIDPTVSAIFTMIKSKLDEDTEKYDEVCEKRRKAVKSRWENGKQKDTKEKQNNTNEYKCMQMDTDTDTDTDTDNDIINIIESGYAFGTGVVKASIISKIIPPKIEWIEAYCKERNNGIDPQKFFDFYESKGWKVGKDKMKNWQASVRTWENRDKPKKEEPKQKAKYDFDALNKMIEEG